jgi:acetylornithine deacetylase
MTQKFLENINIDRLKKLFRDMVDIYSPSGKEEQVLEFLYTYLKSHEFRVKRQSVDENRYNLLVLPKKEIDSELVFVGHVDTIPAYELDDFGWEEKGDRVNGLGTADMKGGCAAMVEAMIASKEILTKDPPAALALVVGEEEDGDGAAQFLGRILFPMGHYRRTHQFAPLSGSFWIYGDFASNFRQKNACIFGQ